MYGFYNKLLNIDLDRQARDIENIDDDILKETLGGKGLGVRLLLERNQPQTDPLGPDNHHIFLSGPANGSSVWGSCRLD